MVKIAYLTNGTPTSGVGHQAEAVKRAIQRLDSHQWALVEYYLNGTTGTLSQEQDILTRLVHLPGKLDAKTINWIRLGWRLPQYLRRGAFDIVHATNQTISFVLPAHGATVVTVHDLIELIRPQQGLARHAARYLYRGIPRAKHIIAVSNYTARSLEKQLQIPADRITVVHNGVGSEFHPIDAFRQTIGYQTLRQELKLPETARVIMSVGSDHPRKNLLTALRAFARLRKDVPEAIFVKVGEPGIRTGRVRLLQEIDQLKLKKSVRFIGSVSDDRLNELYNLADAFIFPSTFEGFGLPPLQAIAAGTPVVTSRSSSLPEVVGDAGLMHSSKDIEGFATSLQRILASPELRAELRAKGIARAREFTWERAAQQTAEVYRNVVS